MSQISPARLTLRVEVGLKIDNPVRGSHGSWQSAAARRSRHRSFVAHAAGQALRAARWEWPRDQAWTVRLTRIAPRAFDTDNLGVALKSVRDQVAEELGRDDSPKAGITWLYAQRKRKPKEHAVIIEIWAGDGRCPACGTMGANLGD